MGIDSVLVWNGGYDAVYREARRQIIARNKFAPKTIKDIDFSDFFESNKDALVYYPVFQGTTGWWGALLGTDARIQSKIIVSAECQLYEVGTANSSARHQLFAAEVLPRQAFFQKIRDCATTIKDMIATDSGTVLTLLSGGNETKIKSCVKGADGEYFGSLGGY